MKQRISPFTHTPGIAGDALIETDFSEDIIMNFESTNSYKYLYKIVGLRGTGKSVEYSKVMNHFRSSKNWLVYALSADGNPLQTLISMLSMEKFINDKTIGQAIQADASADGGIGIVSAEVEVGATVNISKNEHYYSAEATLKKMLKSAKEKGYRVLIGVDDIARTADMVGFLSILGTVLMEPDMDVRFVCTGISKNIEDFVNIPHMSFFVRNESIKITSLDLHRIAAKYRELLKVSHEDAVKLAKFTRGYAYGYQVLGEICFQMQKSIIDEDIEDAFDEMIGSQYDLIWASLTDSERELVRIIVNCKTGLVSEIKAEMPKATGFASLRDRLIKKHILVSKKRGELAVPLPRFKEYIDLWHM